MNAASPGVISAFLPNKFYKDDDDYLNALSNIMTTEYEEIVSNDINLQLDCPDLALARHMTFKDLSEVDFYSGRIADPCRFFAGMVTKNRVGIAV